MRVPSPAAFVFGGAIVLGLGAAHMGIGNDGLGLLLVVFGAWLIAYPPKTRPR